MRPLDSAIFFAPSQTSGKALSDTGCVGSSTSSHQELNSSQGKQLLSVHFSHGLPEFFFANAKATNLGVMGHANCMGHNSF